MTEVDNAVEGSSWREIAAEHDAATDTVAVVERWFVHDPESSNGHYRETGSRTLVSLQRADALAALPHLSQALTGLRVPEDAADQDAYARGLRLATDLGAALARLVDMWDENPAEMERIGLGDAAMRWLDELHALIQGYLRSLLPSENSGPFGEDRAVGPVSGTEPVLLMLTLDELAELRAAVESSEHPSAGSFLSQAVTRAVQDRLAAADSVRKIVDRSRPGVFDLFACSGDGAVEQELR